MRGLKPRDFRCRLKPALPCNQLRDCWSKINVMTVTEDQELIQNAQSGSRSAFEELVCRYDRQVLSIAMSHTGNAEDAKDVYQEVFLRVYRALPKFRFDSKFSTWLHRITTNVCLTHRSKRKRYEYTSIDQEFEGQEGERFSLSEMLADDSRPDQNSTDREISDHVREAMAALSPQQRMVFSLRHYEGYKLREIASMLNCAEGTVKKYLFTATERLRNQLKEVF